MASPKAAHFVAVSDLDQAPESQEGILITVAGRGGNTARNRAEALDIITQMWENAAIPEHLFPDGISQANLQFVPPFENKNPMSDSSETTAPEIPPIVQGAQEIIQLTKLQIAAQEAAQEMNPYIPIIKAVLDRSRPLNEEEITLAKDKSYGKTIEKFGKAIASQEEFQSQCTGNGKLILNASEWQQQQLHPISDDSEE
ncbi:MAG: hypothetical protein F6J87_05845 [Spirulina sp. SIO3F2]|nr:hypothetical protein [Spirulina sp. SIO3F2]